MVVAVLALQEPEPGGLKLLTKPHFAVALVGHDSSSLSVLPTALPPLSAGDVARAAAVASSWCGTTAEGAGDARLWMSENARGDPRPTLCAQRSSAVCRRSWKRAWDMQRADFALEARKQMRRTRQSNLDRRPSASGCRRRPPARRLVGMTRLDLLNSGADAKRTAMLLRDARAVLRRLDILASAAIAADDPAILLIAEARETVERLVTQLGRRGQMQQRRAREAVRRFRTPRRPIGGRAEY